MEHITDTRIEQSEPTAVTLGNFDGLHQGHRSLINLTKQFAEEEGLKSVVFTFSPHPMFVFQRKEDFALIVDPSEKKFQMEKNYVMNVLQKLKMLQLLKLQQTMQLKIKL